VAVTPAVAGGGRDTGVCAPSGFIAGAAAADIRDHGGDGRLDVAIVRSQRPCQAAGVFTRNLVKAAPVVISQLTLRQGRVQAVLFNSGNANACTGVQGFRDALAMCKAAGDACDLDPAQILVCSTGVIGRPMPMSRVLGGVRAAAAALGPEAGDGVARAIMTTDTVPKQVALHHPDNWTVGGMVKGAGMLAPSLATMLCVLTTDAVADASALEQALRRATALTFDRLDVDGSCSTNDTVLLLASGASEIAPSQADLDDAVLRVCDDLCAQLQADAEGVTKRITISVTGAASEDDAVTAARVIARDSLVKTALFGSDANWGRVLAAVGMAPVELNPDRITVSFNGSAVCIDGVGAPGAREVDLSPTDIEVAVDLGVGAAQAAIRTTDLSHAYVEENSAYSS
jgi:glutamate N-acetyltransferase/amino-acid N-acetyltransferase